MTPIPTITDDLLRELEAFYRTTEDEEQLSLIRRLRESEARLWSMCVAVTQKDVERVKRETCNNLDYLSSNGRGGGAMNDDHLMDDDMDDDMDEVYVCMVCGHEDNPDKFGQFCPRCGTDLDELEDSLV